MKWQAFIKIYQYLKKLQCFLMDGTLHQKDGTKITSTSPVTKSDKKLYAHWTSEEHYYISFSANGGIGTMEEQLFNVNESKKLTANSFTKTGYSFAGWNTMPDGTGTKYDDEATVKNPGTLTLYAQWLLIPKTSYTYAGSLTFNGLASEIIDTGVYLFSAENIHKNFEISFNIDYVDTNNSNQSAIMNTKDESRNSMARNSI